MQHLAVLVLGVSLGFAPPDTPRVPSRVPLTPLELHALLTAPTRHVRALTPTLEEVLEAGVLRSPTFAHLMADLDQSDVIVHVVASQNLPPSVGGQVVLVPKPKEYRFLRIQVRVEGPVDNLVVLLGHELRHALEIAAAPEVRDNRALVNLYQRIGASVSGLHQFDTLDAREAGRQVRRELTR